MTNRMRDLLDLINERHGKEAIAIFRKYERLNMKICNFKNHRRFSLRCLSDDLIPVSLRLKNNVRTYISDCIIHRAERSLLNERIRAVNNTLVRLEHGRYMYEIKLSGLLDQDLMKNCSEMIEDLKQKRHRDVLERQISKFKRVKLKNTVKQHSSNSTKVDAQTRFKLRHLCQTNVGL